MSTAITTTTAAEGGLEVFSSLLAVVLEGENTFWLALQTKIRPLEPGWKSTSIFWLYPFEGDVQPFSSVPGFDVTDSVYVLDRSAHSKVEMFATLVIDVQGRRYVKDRVEYFFISYSEVKRLQDLYRSFQKRELAAPPPPPPAPEREAASTTSAPEPQGPADVDKILRVKETRTNKEVAERVKETLEKKEKTPPPQAPPKREAELVKKKSDHCNTEVFHWQDLFLVSHRGSAFLCPSERDNTYGFRLHKVIMADAVALVMFERTAPSSDAVDGHHIGTALHDKAVVGTTLGKRVLVVTPSVWPLPDDSGAAKRPRPADALAPADSATRAKVSAVSPPPPPPPETAAPKAVAPPTVLPPKSDALQAVGVNCWSNVQQAVPPVTELAKQHTFDASPTAPLQTAVFPDGVAVTYSPAVAAKVTPAPPAGSGAEKKSRKAGGHTTPGSAVDEDMRDLLQHIQLAKEHVKL